MYDGLEFTMEEGTQGFPEAPMVRTPNTRMGQTKPLIPPNPKLPGASPPDRLPATQIPVKYTRCISSAE